MSTLVKALLFAVITVALFADVVFVVLATKFNFLIIVPVALSACYLAYMAAHYTIHGVDDTKEKGGE
jgi:hypothetical protein